MRAPVLDQHDRLVIRADTPPEAPAFNGEGAAPNAVLVAGDGRVKAFGLYVTAPTNR
jgi:hypothetical protein